MMQFVSHVTERNLALIKCYNLATLILAQLRKLDMIMTDKTYKPP